MSNQPPKILKVLFPTLADMLWMAAFWGVLIFGRRMMNMDGDLGRHLTIGNYILDHGKIPLRDVFSHTMMGEALTPHEWLVQVVFALAERVFGFNGVILLCALVIAGAFWLVFKQSHAENKPLMIVFSVSLLAMISSMVHWLARPHVFTFLLLAAWMLVLDQLRKGKLKRWWLLPALMLLWANLHGAFIAGFVTWIIYGIGVGWDVFWGRVPEDRPLPAQFWRSYLLGGGTALAASLLNPSWFGLWGTSFGFIGNRYLVARTVEYMSPNFHSVGFWPFLLMIGLIIVVLGLRERKIGSELLFTAAAWLVMGLYSARNIPLFGIVAAPLLVYGLDDLFTQAADRFKLVDRVRQSNNRIQDIDSQLKGFVWPAICLLIAITGLGLGLRFDPQGLGYDFDPQVFPVAAVDWLEENPQEGEMFNHFIWGGYLLYRQWPERRVFIDGQTDFYGEALTRQYAQVIGVQEGWEDVLDQYTVDWAIITADSLAAREIQQELGWQLIYEDETAVILRR
jgi:hypothetical protein